MTTPYVFTRGETLTLALRNLDDVEVEEIGAVAKIYANGIPAGEPVVTFAVEEIADFGDDLGSGWNFTLSAEQTLAMQARLYAMDVRMVIGTGVVITELLVFKIVVGATEEAP